MSRCGSTSPPPLLTTAARTTNDRNELLIHYLEFFVSTPKSEASSLINRLRHRDFLVSMNWTEEHAPLGHPIPHSHRALRGVAVKSPRRHRWTKPAPAHARNEGRDNALEEGSCLPCLPHGGRVCVCVYVNISSACIAVTIIQSSLYRSAINN